jgi:hypothetical protein
VAHAPRAAHHKAAAKPAPTATPTAAEKPTLVAVVTPLREQHEADTTTPTETAGSMEQTTGALPPGQTAAPVVAQPTPAPSPQPSPSPSPQPTATVSPVVTPTPTPGDGPIVTPVPSPTPAPTTP